MVFTSFEVVVDFCGMVDTSDLCSGLKCWMDYWGLDGNM